jgi:hypothetical protein
VLGVPVVPEAVFTAAGRTGGSGMPAAVRVLAGAVDRVLSVGARPLGRGARSGVADAARAHLVGTLPSTCARSRILLDDLTLERYSVALTMRVKHN